MGLVQYLSRIYISNELARALFQRAFCLKVRAQRLRDRRGPAIGSGILGYIPLVIEQIHLP